MKTQGSARPLWQRIAILALIASIIIVAARVTYRHQGQHPVWSGPYFSGAANFDPSRPFDWQLCLGQLKEFRHLTPQLADQHRFSDCEDSYSFRFNEIGFLWIAYVSRTLLPWMSDRQAIITLQLIVHVVLILVALRLLPAGRSRIIFFLLYGANPAVLYFVQFPYRYFWTSVPSLLLLLALRERPWRNGAILLLGVGSPILFFIRQTVLPIVLLTFARLMVTSRVVVVLAGLTIVGAMLASAPRIQKGPWHTIYIGIGAYPNQYVEGLSDNNGYALYQRVTGQTLRMSSPDDNYYDQEVYQAYNEILRAEVERIARAEPMMFLRNAALNVLQSFSVGHPVGHPRLAYASAALGLAVIALLILTRQYWLLVGTGAVSAGFAPYYPPIPAYMFGAYILLVYGIAVASSPASLTSLRQRLGVFSRAP